MHTVTQEKIAYTRKEEHNFANIYWQNLDEQVGEVDFKWGQVITLKLAKFIDTHALSIESGFNVLANAAGGGSNCFFDWLTKTWTQ